MIFVKIAEIQGRGNVCVQTVDIPGESLHREKYDTKGISLRTCPSNLFSNCVRGFNYPMNALYYGKLYQRFLHATDPSYHNRS
jgi:hypothetical protein